MSPRPKPKSRTAATRHPSPPSPRSARPAGDVPVNLVAPLAALAGFLVYAHTLGFGFAWDDMANVLLNEHVRSLRHLPALFAEHTYAGAAGAMAGIGAAHYYRPLVMATLALDHAAWGERAFGYHLTSLLLHAATCAVLARVLLAQLRSPLAALAGALLFAVHPVHVEAVAWISGRADLLLALGAVLALLAWRRWRDGGGRGALAGVGAATVAALFAKETAVVLPLVLALEPARAPQRVGERLRVPALLALICGAFLVLRFALMPPPHEPVPFATRLFTAPQLTAQALWLLLVPLRPSVFYFVHAVSSAASPRLVLPLVVVATAVAAVVWLWRRDRALGFGAVWILITLLPVSGIAGWPKPTPLAERYLVMPSIGWAIVVAVLVERALLRARAATLAVTAAVGMLLAVITWHEALAWRDNTTLLTRITHDAPEWAAGHAALGRVHAQTHEWDAAVAELDAAARLAPGDPQTARELRDALFQAGAASERAGRIDEAAAHDEAALRLDPHSAAAWGALGRVRFEQSRFAAADSAYRRAIALAPSDPLAHQNLGGLLLEQDRNAEAIVELEQALRLDPRLAEAHLNLALARLALGRAADAERDARAGLALAPSPRATLLLAQILVTEGRRDAARAALEPLLRPEADPRLRAEASKLLTGR